jgi:hypothetical protein
VANRTIAPIAGDSLTLEIGGRGIQTEPLNVGPEGSASVAFAPFTVPSRNMRVTVRAGVTRSQPTTCSTWSCHRRRPSESSSSTAARRPAPVST